MKGHHHGHELPFCFDLACWFVSRSVNVVSCESCMLNE